MWKLAPDSWTGELARLFNYKDAWVPFNAALIRKASADNRITLILLASVAWADAASMPDFVASYNAPVGSAFRECTSYGHRMLQHHDRVANALGVAP